MNFNDMFCLFTSTNRLIVQGAKWFPTLPQLLAQLGTYHSNNNDDYIYMLFIKPALKFFIKPKLK